MTIAKVADVFPSQSGSAQKPGSTGNPVPFPTAHLGKWWNVWDHNDVLSFTAKDIFDGVDDSSYSSGTTLLEAHGAYLSTPSFYRKMAAQITQAISGDGT